MKEFFKPNASKVIIFLTLTLSAVAFWIAGGYVILRPVLFYLLVYPLALIRGGMEARSNDWIIVLPYLFIAWLVLLYPLSCLIYHYYKRAKK
jgi:hypothetical protein